MKKLLLFSLVQILTSLSAYSQKEANNWYFGVRAGITFQTDSATALGGGQLNSLEGCATISDKVTGQLLFYTDGEKVWNRNHQIMNNGTGLLGGSSGTQSALIVPDPGNSDQYYIFTAPDLTLSPTPRTTKLHYSLVSLQNPNGDVILKNVVVYDNVAEKLTGTIDCSNNGAWVVAHHRRNNTFYSFHVTSTGVNTTPVISQYTENAIDHTAGYIKISPDKSKIAIASHDAPSFLAMFDFNASTGDISNYRLLGVPANNEMFYGVSFSPDNTKLYAIGKTIIGPTTYRSALFQYEANLGDANSIKNSRVVFPVRLPVQFVSALQLGPDGRLYIASTYRPYLDIIDHPNQKGNLCGYRADALTLTSNSNLGLPNFMDYNFGRSTDTVVLCASGNVHIGPPSMSGFSYSWDPVTGLDNPFISNPTIVGTAQTNEYKLKVTNNNGCESFQTYVVKKALKITADQVQPICAGSKIQLSASGGDTYSWFPTTDLDNPTKQNPIASPKSNTRYKVIGTRGGCIDSAFVNIDVYQAFSSAGVDTSVCLGDVVQLGAFSNIGTTYSWDPILDLSNPNVANPFCTPSQSRKYILKAVTASGCESLDTVLISVKKVTANAAQAQSICAGSSVQLSASGGDRYLWSPSTGLDSPVKADPIASPKTSTRYKVIVIQGNCQDSAFVAVDVINPIANAGQDKTICAGASAQIGSPAIPGTTYSWQPDIGLNDQFSANPTASPSTTTRYILTVSKNGCMAYDTVMVTVGNLKAVVSKDVDICGGEKVQLSASGGSEYSWEPKIGLDNPNISNPIATPTKTTRYKVIVSSGKCIDSAFVTVNVKPNSLANAGDDKIICPGASIQIGSEPQSGYQYTWQPKYGLDDSSKSNPTASPNITTKYILTVSNSTGGCSSSDTVTISVGNIVAKVSKDTNICAGSTIQLASSGGNEYSWTPTTGLSNPTIANPIASPDSTTKYRVIVSSGTCLDSGFVTITVNPSPTANAGDDKTICSGSSAQLGTPGRTGYLYSWQPSFGLDDASTAMPTATVAKTTTYFLTVSDGSSCVGFDSVTVNVGNIQATVSSDTSICTGSGVKLSSSGGSNYQWSPIIGLDNPKISSPIATPSTTTTYKVIVSSGECIDSAEVTVNVIPPPLADAGENKFICAGDKEIIGIQTVPGNTYSWSPTEGLITPNESQTIASPASTTQYILSVRNYIGCETTDTVIVTINPVNERIFTLTPPIVSIIPGKPFQTSLHIPKDVISWSIHLGYDKLTVKYDSIIETSNIALTLPPFEQNGKLFLKGTGENGNIIIRFNTFLPQTTDTLLPIDLTIDSSIVQSCIGTIGHGNILQLGEYCAKAIRSVSSTGKYNYLTASSNNINFGIGLPGKVLLELYDYTGTLKVVLTDDEFDAGEYSIDLDLPTGVYFTHIISGMFNDVQKVVIVR